MLKIGRLFRGLNASGVAEGARPALTDRSRLDSRAERDGELEQGECGDEECASTASPFCGSLESKSHISIIVQRLAVSRFVSLSTLPIDTLYSYESNWRWATRRYSVTVLTS